MRRPEEEARTRHHLALMVRMSGVTHKDIDTELGWCRGTTSQVLKGRTELKVRHILDILDICQVPSAMYFAAVFLGEGAQSQWSNQRRSEARDVPFANMVAELTGFGYPPRRGPLPPPEPDAAVRLQALFHELAERLPVLMAMQKPLPSSEPAAPAAPAAEVKKTPKSPVDKKPKTDKKPSKDKAPTSGGPRPKNIKS